MHSRRPTDCRFFRHTPPAQQACALAGLFMDLSTALGTGFGDTPRRAAAADFAAYSTTAAYSSPILCTVQNKPRTTMAQEPPTTTPQR
jgi:hypothetical protein